MSPVNSSEETPTTTEVEASVDSGSLPDQPDESMREYYQLQRMLLRTTLVMTAIAFCGVWLFYSLNVALNYLIGSSVGVIYLRMLSRSVEQLGRQRQKLGSNRLALLIGVIFVASRLNQLQILPIFLGFLTYKVALIAYVLWITLTPKST